jgi:hypothetical protein
LHLGAVCTLTFPSCACGRGIVFVRADRPDAPEVPAHAAYAVAERAPHRARRGCRRAAHGGARARRRRRLGIDDLVIDDGRPAEPPILDGSAGPFLRRSWTRVSSPTGARLRRHALSCRAGARDRRRERLRSVPGGFAVDRGEHRLRAPAHRRAGGRCVDPPASFAGELAWARTFGFVHEVEMLRAKGADPGGRRRRTPSCSTSSGSSGRPLRWPTSSCGTRRWIASATSRSPGDACARASSPTSRATVARSPRAPAMLRGGRAAPAGEGRPLRPAPPTPPPAPRAPVRIDASTDHAGAPHRYPVPARRQQSSS